MNRYAWPSRILSVVHARRWIASALVAERGRVRVEGPVEVYRAKHWGVTARFRVLPHNTSPCAAKETGGRAAPNEDVVFKAALNPLDFYAPAVYRLLARAAPQHVPHLLAAEVLGGPTFTDTRPRAGWAPHVARAQHGRLYALFRPFSGTRVAQSDRPDAAAEMARTAARIQAAVAALPACATEGVPRVPVARVPALYEEVLRRMRDHYLPRWLAGRGNFPGEHGDPRAALAALQGFAPQVERWTAELAAGGWPESIDHTDLHIGNGVIREDGSVLIFDWEDAVISCPFYSMEELLWRCGDRAEEARAAYAEALPWGTRSERERALDLGKELGEIARAHLVEVLRESFGFPGRGAGPAGFVGHALRVWPRFD